ncbi:MAG: ISL3 family transposase [Deltaproteobacteria bacterium]|nr:ISL3 family transposase [Deltaproteobacteria bacterium]
MSTSLLYHGFCIRGYHYIRSLFVRGRIVFKIKQDRFSLRCPECHSKELILKGHVSRVFRTLPIGNKPVFIEFAIPRIKCLACQVIKQVKIAFADTRRTYTKAFERYVLELSRHMTISDVARHLGVGWDMVKDIQKRYLNRRFSKPKLTQLKQIAIDEISIGSGHRYLTVVLDLTTGAVVFIGSGKGSEALIPFWKRIKRCKAKIEAVAIDMSPAYIKAVTKNLPEAVIVFDHFHVVKLFNDQLAEFRRSLQSQMESKKNAQFLKGTRWLLLKNPENLNPRKNERQKLEQALEINKPLATAYYLKEELRQLWKQHSKFHAANLMNTWILKAKASDIRFLGHFADTLEKHWEGILAYYNHNISTAPLEGTNNKIKTLQRQAYGFRDMEFFKLKIYALHRTRYALVG